MPVDEARRRVTRYATRSTGWTVKHVHERWQAEHGGTRSCSWAKKTLQAAGHVGRAPRRGAHRKKRPRKPLPGMLLHQDGSPHEWVPHCQWDLIVTLDDATSAIYSAFFVEEEGTLSSLRGLQEGMETKGLFSSLYTDRGSHYWHTDEAGGKVNKTRLTQVHRALQQLGITLIPAYAPEARGRSERAFRTLQDRLPKEMRLLQISSWQAGNAYLPAFIEHFNQRFAVPPRSSLDAHRSLTPQENLDTILTWQEQRIVSKNLTVQFDKVVYQIQTDRPGYALRKASVTVCRDAQHKVTLLYKGQALSYNVFHQQIRQCEVVLSKDLNQSIPRQPAKPAPDHPWRNYAQPKNHRSAPALPRGDISTLENK